jgi:hypothetical protein
MLINLFISVVWLALTAWLGNKILFKILPLDKRLIFPLGIFLPIFLLGLIANIFTAWLKLNDLAIIISGLIVLLVLLAGWLGVRKRTTLPAEMIEADGRYRWPKLLSFVFIILIAIAGWLLFASQSGGNLSSPWQAITVWYLPVTFGALLLLLAAVFSRAKITGVLIMIVLSSLLIHSYLLVYENGVGGDRWRHLASENRIMAGLEYQPTLISKDLWQSNILGLKVPRALIDPGKISYGLQWSLEIITSQATGLDVFQVNKLLLPILWSIFLPLIIAALAGLIWPNRLFILFSAALAGFFYLLQYYGSQGLPVGYGVLWWSFFLIFAAAAIKSPASKRCYPVLVLFTILMYFNYSLAFILSIMALVLALAFKLKPALKYLIIFLLAASIFVLELMLSGGQLVFNGLWSWWRDGNLLLFEAGRNLPYISTYKFLALSIFFILILAAILINIFRGKNRLMNFIAWFFIIIMSNYALAWIFIDGNLNLARRLTVFAALLLPLVIIWGISYNLKNSKKLSLAAVIIISCLLGLLAYRSGPVLPVSVSSADWQTAQLVWQEIKDDYNNYCVLGDLELLLPLEALSNKEVANGNFSWQENYVETARPRLYQKLISGGDYLIIDEVLMASQKQHCVFAVRQDISATMPRQFINWLGQNLQSITSSDYLIWKK